MKRFTRKERIEYEDKWVTGEVWIDENGYARGEAIDQLAQYENAEKSECEECCGVAEMELPLSSGVRKVNFCPMCGRKL